MGQTGKISISYAREELETALAIQWDLPWGVPFIFPVRIDQTNLPIKWWDSTGRWVFKYMWVDLSSDWDSGIKLLTEELRKRPEPVSKKTYFVYYVIGSASLFVPIYGWLFFRDGIPLLPTDAVGLLIILGMIFGTPLLLTMVAAMISVKFAGKTKTKLGACCSGLFTAILLLLFIVLGQG